MNATQQLQIPFIRAAFFASFLWGGVGGFEVSAADLAERHYGGRILEVPRVSIPEEARVPSAISGLQSTSVEVDGYLEDTAWLSATQTEDFWCSLENRAPSDPTEVLVMMDEDYLYFGFRLFDSEPDAIEARRTVRDTGFGYDDVVIVELDTFFNRRDISTFSLNPLGTQSDSIAGGRSDKVEWKGDWLGGATRTEYGWSAEFAIPLSILNYRSGDSIFGLNFKRYQNRTGEYSWWSDVSPLDRPELMGQLTGLELPESASRKAWTFMPFILAGKNIPDKSGEIKDTLITGGMDIRYQPKPDLTAVISLNPDFSQVEEAVTDISFSYTEKAVADNRPFFAEGRGYFTDGNQYFYSNRAADFDYGGKTFGRWGDNQFAFLASSAPDDRQDFVGRWVHEIGETHSVAAAMTGTQQEVYDNVMGLVRFKGRQKNGLTYSTDLSMTDTRGVADSDPRADQGMHAEGSLGWAWDYWSVSSDADYYDDNYFPALALLNGDRPGTRSYGGSLNYYREQTDRFFRVVSGYAGHLLRQTDEGDVQNRKWYAGGSVEIQPQIRTTVYAESGPYRPVGAQRGEFVDFTYQDSYYSVALDFLTRSSVLSLGTQYDWGDLGGADYELMSFYVTWQPLDVINLEASYETSDSYGETEQTVLSGSWQITPEDSIGGRVIEYKSTYVTDRYYRFTYGRRVRQGFDLFFVYDNSPYLEEQYSIKIVKTF